MITVQDVDHVIGLVLFENLGNRMTDAVCLGMQKQVVHLCHRISEDADRAIKLAESNHALD